MGLKLEVIFISIFFLGFQSLQMISKVPNSEPIFSQHIKYSILMFHNGLTYHLKVILQ